MKDFSFLNYLNISKKWDPLYLSLHPELEESLIRLFREGFSGQDLHYKPVHTEIK
jgi:hypothetical protein